jgi:hypothetical protein
MALNTTVLQSDGSSNSFHVLDGWESGWGISLPDLPATRWPEKAGLCSIHLFLFDLDSQVLRGVVRNLLEIMR